MPIEETVDIKKVAKLSSLRFSREEEEVLGKELEKIIEAFDKIKNIPTEGVEALMSPVDENITPREDKVVESIPTEELLELAPESSGRLYKVPKVIS